MARKSGAAGWRKTNAARAATRKTIKYMKYKKKAASNFEFYIHMMTMKPNTMYRLRKKTKHNNIVFRVVTNDGSVWGFLKYMFFD